MWSNHQKKTNNQAAVFVSDAYEFKVLIILLHLEFRINTERKRFFFLHI